mmetsp:Transcript_20243/g.64390  ORF Transcript_20243/g.64390 Transcript_20243/m.64390 type:complete len:143 (-) Transcript_20243:63-491(-)
MEHPERGCCGMQKAQQSQVTAMGLNFISVVAIIMVNKQLFASTIFPVTLLASLHFGVGSLFLFLLKAAGHFELPKSYTMSGSLWLLVLAQSCAVVFNNFSLSHNSIGFYQLAKQMQMPMVATIDFVMHGSTPPSPETLSPQS